MSSTSLTVLEIAPARGWIGLRLRELWEYRELLYFLAWREIKVRYKQTALGIAWVVLQPLLAMLIFSLFFGRLARIPSDGLPYPLFAFAGLVPWTFFANALTLSSNSLITSAHLITKVYFPRLALPISSILAGLLDLLIATGVLGLFMALYGVAPSARAVWLPLLALLAAITALGVGLWLSALNVEYRDFKYTVPFLTQLWLFATPIAYPSSLVPEGWRALYALNPMVGVVEGFRWALLAAPTHPGNSVFVSSLAAALLLVSGAVYFRRMERSFADVI